jgi:hypothetical protein
MTYFDIADVPLGFNHVARFIVANHSIIYTRLDRRDAQRLLESR